MTRSEISCFLWTIGDLNRLPGFRAKQESTNESQSRRPLLLCLVLTPAVGYHQPDRKTPEHHILVCGDRFLHFEFDRRVVIGPRVGRMLLECTEEMRVRIDVPGQREILETDLQVPRDAPQISVRTKAFFAANGSERISTVEVDERGFQSGPPANFWDGGDLVRILFQVYITMALRVARRPMVGQAYRLGGPCDRDAHASSTQQ